ncbi:hypothetical protein FRB94_011492 [Tulasnella sp. JGI-2019a]|nr:hypothetical protein FRB94_011492 [Tulasnella sp. JGI-2019a]KAG8997064.1 hypothetical protein FRB93_000557 [Tulasnella sp. JGI-2019a]KAG9033914.1 hypothetical protein FRB95_014117 [Tulasnella sp. JGI-2019a]
MLFAVAILNLLLVSTALAAPRTLADRVRRRREGRQSKVRRSIGPDVQPGQTATTYSTHNWAGAVWDTYPVNSFQAVTGTFVVPNPTLSRGQNWGAACAWVGIDGSTCLNAILQAGVDFYNDNGEISYYTWYEWYPAVSIDFEGVTMAAGHSVAITVTATSSTSGTVVMENKSTKQIATSFVNSTYPLCQQNAEWIVEDFEQDGSMLPFANFGTITFTESYATTLAGAKLDTTNTTIINIEQYRQLLTSVSAGSGNVTIQYLDVPSY